MRRAKAGCVSWSPGGPGEMAVSGAIAAGLELGGDLICCGVGPHYLRSEHPRMILTI